MKIEEISTKLLKIRQKQTEIFLVKHLKVAYARLEKNSITKSIHVYMNMNVVFQIKYYRYIEKRTQHGVFRGLNLKLKYH